MVFSRPLDHYQLLKLDLDDWSAWQELPSGYRFIDVDRLDSELDREQEKALLQSEFPYWEIPFHRQMPGSAHQGVLAVVHEQELAAVAYACDRNDADIEGYAQIHYAVVRGDHRGKKLLPAMVSEMFKRLLEARQVGHYRGWRLKGIRGGVFFSDREGHQDMYERWGGQHLHDKPKPGSAGAETNRG